VPPPDETAADLVAFYGGARTAADRAIEEVGLDETGTSWFGSTVSMRWVLIHMIRRDRGTPATWTFSGS